MMMRVFHNIIFFTTITSSLNVGNAFVISTNISTSRIARTLPFPLYETSSSSSSSPSSSTSSISSSTEEVLPIIEGLLSEMHMSKYTFRIVVVGNGAILETTSKLGPIMKSSISPKTGGKLVTLASDDQSFEFHVKVEEVGKIVFVQSVHPASTTTTAAAAAEEQCEEMKVLRICRLMKEDGGSICSLILNEYGQDAIDWFTEMERRYQYGN